MATLMEIKKFSRASQELSDDPMTALIWIRKPEAFLIQVLPSMKNEKCIKPVRFNPGITFNFPITIIAGNRKSVVSTILSDRKLAMDVRKGTIIYDGEDAKDIINATYLIS